MKLHRIYFLKRSDGLVKIGTTTSLDARMTALAVGHGPLELLRVVNGGRRREGELHQAFKRFWEYGEWFRSEGGALDSLIETIEDGAQVPVDVADARSEWERGEAEFMARTRALVDDLVKLRTDRDRLKREAGIDALNAEHGFSKHFLRHILSERGSTVSAYGFERILMARRIEMQALLNHLRGELGRVGSDDLDALELGRELDRIEHELKRRSGLRAIAAEIEAKRARVG